MQIKDWDWQHSSRHVMEMRKRGKHSKLRWTWLQCCNEMIQPYMNKKASCLFYTHVYVKCTLQITNIIITTILFDNFFPSPMLQEHLEHQQTYACSTVQYNHKGLPNCANQKLTRPGELVQAQTGILVSLNSTANFQRFPQTFLLGSPCAQYSENSQEGRSILSSPKCQMFTPATWGELIELINFIHIIISGGSLTSGSSVYFGCHLI